ncbi:MAG: shikimate dehydrogenase, partial [Alphaproteobacteria bacterium]|nr:shikimate dehydrogenase [Alphaproteobacteria bacterium]
MITGAARVAGVIGWPVAHSRSPAIHGCWLDRYGIDGAYVPLAVAPEDLRTVLKGLTLAGFAGFNLTLPHKETVMELLDEVSPMARRVGAVNTVVIGPDRRLIGRNTDVFGFAESLKRVGLSPDSPPARAVVIGAGGAARAVVAALGGLGTGSVSVLNRTP